MEILGKILLIILGIATIFILLMLASTLLKWKIYPEKVEISGKKPYVIDLLIKHIYDCFERYEGKRESAICSYITINSLEDISSSDVIDSLDPMRIDKSKVKVGDLGSFGEIVIRYENQNIYVEKVKYERISS